MNSGTVCFIEFLTVRAWCGTILPRLVWWRWSGGQRVTRCYVIDSSRWGQAFAQASRWLSGVQVERLHFRLLDVRDEQGQLLRLRIAYKDLGEVQREIMADPVFRRSLESLPQDEAVRTYLAKALSVISFTDRQTVWRALVTIQVCAWSLRRENHAQRALYFLERRVGWNAIARYATTAGLGLIAVPRSLDLSVWRRWLITPELKRFLYRLQAYGITGMKRIASAQRVSVGAKPQRARLAVEYYGSLNLDDPVRHSDLFFWKASPLPATDVVVTFNIEAHPLNGEKMDELQRHGIGAIAMRPKAVATPAAQVFIPRLLGDRESRAPRTVSPPGLEGQWWRAQLRKYYREERAYWSEFFQATQVKVYVSWFRYTETHCAITDALERTGGVSAIYQRAYESFPSAETAISADIFFAYAPAMAEIERQSGSRMSYLVATGYLGDYRFALVRDEAQRIRAALQERGAQRIVAFADENSLDDARWHTGHDVERESYAFLLERVLTEPWLGLVIKPKAPASLRRRLGPVAELLKRAEATGRCKVFQQGPLQGAYPPAVAALASDVMIHGHLNAATAGVEGALAGVPTLLVDRLGWSVSPLYRLGVGTVVFKEWDALWKTCLEHWNRPQGVPGFGDWSSMLDELDPFRDGRAAERMGTYLQWLLEGFQAGLDRNTVMADAAERYGARWGRKNIVRFNESAFTVPRQEPMADSRVVVEAAA